MMTDTKKRKKTEPGDPFEQFLQFISSGSVLLMLATAIAVVWANVNHETYEHTWHAFFNIDTKLFKIKMGLLHWINDGLMAIFFFVVGLEIKREFMAGELQSVKQAALPVFAAIGGMVVPILVFLTFGLHQEAADGWGVPMATDIAFSLGVLAVLGKRVPLTLKVFLTALAIVDDLGAVLVIALFYGGELNWMFIGFAMLLLGVLAFANYKKVQDLKLYTFVGFIIWYLFLMSGMKGPGSGLHATIAGVLIALTIPARPKVHVDDFMVRIKNGLKRFDSVPESPNEIVLTPEQLAAINEIEYSAKKVQSPLQYIEHQFHGFVNLFILPVFALANAGVTLVAVTTQGQIFSTVSAAIAVSLVVGKVVGISFFAWLAVKLKFATKPRQTSWLTFIGLGCLGGIGFTMSIFIAGLAYTGELLNQAKIGIFIGSIVAGVAGYYLLKYSLKRDEERSSIMIK